MGIGMTGAGIITDGLALRGDLAEKINGSRNVLNAVVKE